MKKFVREIVAAFFRFSGVLFLARNIFFRNKVTIVTYHNPEYDVLKRHMEYLAKHYNFVSLDSFVNSLYENSFVDLPPKSLVITFDDGYKENSALLDIFRNHHVCPTIFLCSHIVDTNRKFWFETGVHHVEALKGVDDKARLSFLKDEVNYDPLREYNTRQALNLDEMTHMISEVDFQSHSRYHPILTHLSDAACKDEIEGSKTHLESLLKREIKHFKFPNGDYEEREISYVRTSGYRSSMTLDPGGNDLNSDPYRLKSAVVDDDASINVLAVQVNDVFIFLKSRFRGLHRSKVPSGQKGKGSK